MAYIMFTQRLNFDDAFNHIKGKRGVANPNIGFVAQLMNFYNRIMGNFEALPVRVYAIGSHQVETPQYVVARMVKSNLNIINNSAPRTPIYP
jgi:hypothetical protein